MRKTVKTLGALSAIALTLWFSSASPSAAADAWPSRPVRLIVTLGPGSGVDIGARLFADKLSAKWGQSVVVENKPGGDGMLVARVEREAKGARAQVGGGLPGAVRVTARDAGEQAPASRPGRDPDAS